MRLIRQIDTHDCGIAVAATLSGHGYRTALHFARFRHRERGLNVREMILLLSHLTNYRWTQRQDVTHGHLWLRDTYFADDFAPPFVRQRGNAIIVARHIDAPVGHWIAIRNRIVYDPAFRRPYPIAEYPHGSWVVLRDVQCEWEL